MPKDFFRFLNFVKIGVVAFAIGWCVFAIEPATASEGTDVLVGIKTLSMLNRELPSPLVMGIVYDPSNPESKANAESIKALLDKGVKTSEGTAVSGQLLPLSKINELANVSVAFITTGVRDHFDAIAQLSATHNILTMTSDLDCVRANKCVLGIASKNIVEIYLSRAASETAKINFDSAFIMLVKKV